MAYWLSILEQVTLARHSANLTYIGTYYILFEILETGEKWNAPSIRS